MIGVMSEAVTLIGRLEPLLDHVECHRISAMSSHETRELPSCAKQSGRGVDVSCCSETALATLCKGPSSPSRSPRPSAARTHAHSTGSESNSCPTISPVFLPLHPLPLQKLRHIDLPPQAQSFIAIWAISFPCHISQSRHLLCRQPFTHFH